MQQRIPAFCTQCRSRCGCTALVEDGKLLGVEPLVAGLAPGAVFGQHGWWARGEAGTPYDAAHPMAANVNNAIATDRADPVSGSIPLRCSACEVVKLAP